MTLKPILLYGATGYTGRLCLAALESLKQPYLIGGRDRAGLEALAGAHCQGVRVAPVEALGDIFDGVGCVLTAVGPFARLGLTVLDAAIAAGAHYVDTTGEQTFLRAALERHDAAQAAGVTALPACGIEYLPMFLGAALLGEGPVHTYLWLDDFHPTQGSVRSMVGMAGVGPTTAPRHVRFEREGYAIQIPGAEELFVHPESRTHLVLKAHEAWGFTALWPLAKLFSPARFADRIAAKVTDPSPAQRAADGFHLVVQSDQRWLLLEGRDVYASTGRYAAAVAQRLVQGAALQTGVLSAGKALDSKAMLETLGLDVRWGEQV